MWLGFSLSSQLDVLHVTALAVPDAPSATPHLVAHPVGSPAVHVPAIRNSRIYSQSTEHQCRQRHHTRVRQAPQQNRVRTRVVVLLPVRMAVMLPPHANHVR